MTKHIRAFAAIFAALFVVPLGLASTADARGRTGSHRVGGYNSHGKGSHYYGGR